MGLRDEDHENVRNWLAKAERGDFAETKARGGNTLPFSGGGWGGYGGGNQWFGDGKLGAYIGSGRLPGAKANYHAKAGPLDKNVVVASCIGWIIDNAVQAVIQVAKRNPQTGIADKDVIHPHAMISMLRHPNPYYSWRTLLKSTVASRKICGYAYWYILRNYGGNPVGVRWLPPGTLNPKVPANGQVSSNYIDTYVYKVGSFKREIPAKDIVHFRDGINPSNERQGANRLEAGLRSICSVNEAETYTASILENMGVSPYLFTGIDSATGQPLDLDDATVQAMQEEFDGATTSQNRGRLAVFKDPVQVTPLGMSPQDMALTSILDRPVSFICSLLRVSPMVVGYPDEARTYSNMGEARSAGHEDCIVPLQDDLADDIDFQLLPEFGDPETQATTWDRSRTLALQEGQDERMNRAVSGWSGGVAFFNEARTAASLPPFPGADTLLLVGGQVVDMKQVIAAANEPPVEIKPEDVTREDDAEDEVENDDIAGIKRHFNEPKKRKGDLTGGHWVTVEGRHEYWGKNGKLMAGGSHLPQHTDRVPSPESIVGGPEQEHGTEREHHIVRALGGKHVGRRNGKDQPLDGVVRAGGKRHGLEVKTLSKGKKQNIVMHNDALLRKVKYQDKSSSRIVHTVAVDDRATYGGGKFSEHYSGHQLYYKRGAGAFPLSKMHKVKDLDELRSLMHAKHEDLPKSAQHEAGENWTPKGEARIKLEKNAKKDHEGRLTRQRVARSEGRGWVDPNKKSKSKV